MFKKALVFILVLFFTAALLPLWIMWRDFWVSRLDADTVRPADAAVVLSTRAYEGGRLNPCLVARVEAAVELYRAGKVKKLVMTGGVSRDLQSSAGNMQMIAEKMGVSKADIFRSGKRAIRLKTSCSAENLLKTARVSSLSVPVFTWRGRG